MRTPTVASLALWMSVFTGTAAAEPFTVLPNGDLVYDVAFTTSGSFTCGLVPGCRVSGPNAVTLSSGSGSVTLTFTGVDQTLQVGHRLVPVSVGTLTATSADPAFTFPTLGPHVPVTHLHHVFSLTSPVRGTIRTNFWLGPGGGSVLPLLLGPSDFGFRNLPNPPGYGYTTLIFTLNPFPFSVSPGSSTELRTVAGAVPEPATMMLVGSGLAGAALLRRRQSARARHRLY